jgi:photosystem II PsbU protein
VGTTAQRPDLKNCKSLLAAAVGAGVTPVALQSCMAAPVIPVQTETSMKRLVSWLMSGVLMASLLFGLVMAPAAYADELSNVADEKIAERGDKVDLNNCSVRRFQAYPGMYPTLAGKIVLGGPYNSVDDLFNLDLTERQKELVEKYKDNFTVTPASIALNEGFDRINDGQYR